MGFIDDELQEVSKLCQNVVDGSRLVSCVRTMVRVEITKTKFKTIIACIQFPEDYPRTPLLIELKSKTLSVKLLDGLTEVCEKECKKLLGKAQVLPTLKFIRNFIDENPLICCYDEISAVKEILVNNDELKLKQKHSCISLKVHQGLYYFKAKVEVPDNYPVACVKVEDADTNFPPLFTRHLLGQGRELARRCVEPPLKKKPQQPFTPSPSLKTVTSFLINSNYSAQVHKDFATGTLSVVQANMSARQPRKCRDKRNSRYARRKTLLRTLVSLTLSCDIHEDSSIPWG
ncbi:unnamed protein product [Xylocopa violacea]|uniref:RWD domain-containing protein n=1 Tax=Xylocopa violacea TaxID=135666 RepID=A0ABP1NGV5_XYLVO